MTDGLWVIEFSKRKYGPPILAVFCIAIGSVFVVFAWLGLLQAERLSKEGVRTTAEVIDSRVSQDIHLQSNYDLRFRFKVPGKSQWFERHDDPIGDRAQIWSTLPKKDWDVAVQSGHVSIIYLPSNPRICDIAKGHGSMGPYRFGIGMGAAMFVTGAVWLPTWIMRRGQKTSFDRRLFA